MLLAHIVYEGLLTFVPSAISSGVKDAAFVGGELWIASTMSLATDVRAVWVFLLTSKWRAAYNAHLG